MHNYKLIEHTADTGIRVKGRDLPELFRNAALAMFDIIAEKRQKTEDRRPKTEIIVKQQADSLEELFINWLNELLSLSATEEKIFCDFKFKTLDKYRVEADVSACDMKHYRINTEIKAATYHNLKIEKTQKDWQAEVIFDV